MIEIDALCQGDYFGKRDAIHCVKTIPIADVAPKSEVAKKVLLELKKQIHDKAVYTNSQDIPNYIHLKVFDAVLNNCIKQYAEGADNEQVSQ